MRYGAIIFFAVLQAKWAGFYMPARQTAIKWIYFGLLPRVAYSAQSRALGWNPVGIPGKIRFTLACPEKWNITH